MSTQTQHPWRATARTVFAAIIALAAIWAAVIEAAGIDQTETIVAASVAVAGGITRVMALGSVNAWLARFVPFLAAEPTGNADGATE